MRAVSAYQGGRPSSLEGGLQSSAFYMQKSKPLAFCGLPGKQKSARKLPRTAELERSEILIPVPIRYVRVLRLPLGQFE